MYLKRISICGFKSFCDRVDFEFGPGITCIVGPNGCGKSNVVDAFKWVLGEQSARSLRGRQMSDMIFSGSSTRRSSSVAQVDLVFDNADRSLPMDHDEVMITRKLYRSGESEYQLNQDIVRLKDIRELFFDTGIGVDAYSVVEQGRVDSLLQSSPVDRRIIFEEAAGISKYKARRREAERKLDRTQQNLLRVSDVIEELEKRLRSVKLQAGKARNYKEYEARLNELRSSFAMAEYHRFSREIGDLENEVRDRGDRVTGLRTNIGRHETGEAQLLAKLDRLGEVINEADSAFIQTKSERLALEERIEAAAHRAEEQRAQRESSRERHELDLERQTNCGRDLAKMEQTAATLQDQTQHLHGKIDELIEHDRAHARELTEAQAELEDEKEGIIDLLRQSAKMHNEMVRLNTYRESLVGQKGRLGERDARISGELESALTQRAQHQARLREVEALIIDQTEKLEAKKTEAARVGAMRQRLVDELARNKEERSAMDSRRELLEDLEQRMEGVGAAARQLLDRKQQDDAPPSLQGLAGLVADIFETDVAHAPVIEAVLGESAQHVVMTDSRGVVSDRATFGDLPGRLTLLCLDRLPPIINTGDFSETPGFVARAIDLVRFSESFELLARHLLGKTIVVDSLETACTLASVDVAGHRFVTLKGELVEPDGRIIVGPASSAGGLISRKSELRELGTRRIALEELILKLDDQLNRTDAETHHLENVQQALRQAVHDATTGKVETSAALQNVGEKVDRLTSEQPLIAQEITMLEQQIDDVLEKSFEATRSLETIEAENKEREAAVETRQAGIDEIVDARIVVQEELTHTKVQAGQLTEKRASTAENINSLRRNLHELDLAIANVTNEMQQCEERITDAENTVREGNEKLTSLSSRVLGLEQQCEELRRQRERMRGESDSLTTAMRETRSLLESAEAEAHEVDMSLAQVKVRRDELVTRVLEEMEIDLAKRYAEYEHQEQDWEEVETSISELRRKMDRLGNVNLDAIRELDELEERHSFLAGQRDDLTDSHRQLEQLIERLNQESKERFEKTFQEIRENFRTLFRKLFGGGRADIVLEDTDDILECGIEILAQPPGKELQAISLMSGGEKSLTAIALLMSIFSTRPAPFAILDEVDAALDEANNDRFNMIIKEFVTKAQFLIITHSKWTMNIADRLYGVTMQEPGVSARVSVELTGQNVA